MDSLLKDGGDDPAGAAPRRVEVDEDKLALSEGSVPLGLATMNLLILATMEQDDESSEQ